MRRLGIHRTTPLMILVGRTGSSMKKMAVGALPIAAAYLLLAIVASSAGTDRANWFAAHRHSQALWIDFEASSPAAGHGLYGLLFDACP
jgi:hypothetical protein